MKFTLKHIVIGLLVRKATDVADRGRHQTHVSLRCVVCLFEFHERLAGHAYA